MLRVEFVTSLWSVGCWKADSYAYNSGGSHDVYSRSFVLGAVTCVIDPGYQMTYGLMPYGPTVHCSV